MTQDTQCLICKRQEENSNPDIVLETKSFVVRHSRETNILGYLVIEAKRHILDLTEASDEEAEGYGSLLKQVMSLIRKLTGAERIYTFSLGEAVPHFHVHVIPRTDSLPRFFRGRGIMSYPLEPGLKEEQMQEVCKSLRYIVKTSAIVP
ncbi:MAG: HIT family protein [Candidatus Obscuribacterales bacterium]|nr:HIT family protein [Candidatus Obscuribacterales bacterium]